MNNKIVGKVEHTKEPTCSYASITLASSSSSYPTWSIRGPLTDQKDRRPASYKKKAE